VLYEFDRLIEFNIMTSLARFLLRSLLHPLSNLGGSLGERGVDYNEDIPNLADDFNDWLGPPRDVALWS
jgi:hypothetical protein